MGYKFLLNRLCGCLGGFLGFKWGYGDLLVFFTWFIDFFNLLFKIYVKSFG